MSKRIIRALIARFSSLKSRLRGWWLLRSTLGLELGRNVTIGRGCTIRTSDGGSIDVAEHCDIAENVDIIAREGRIRIGAGGFIGKGSVLTAKTYIHIGADCLIAEYVTIRDQDHKVEAGKVTARNGFDTAAIYVEDNVWIGAKATILKGVRIGKNAVIAAGAVVTKDVPDNMLAKGVPARCTAISNGQDVETENSTIDSESGNRGGRARLRDTG